jgi:hypothetical protein
MILIIGSTTKEDTDWVPFEIRYAVDECKIPLIAAYPNYEYIMAPQLLSSLWPNALAERIAAGSAHIIHIPFKREALRDAVDQFVHNNFPLGGGLGYYSREAYASWGGVPIAA